MMGGEGEHLLEGLLAVEGPGRAMPVDDDVVADIEGVALRSHCGGPQGEEEIAPMRHSLDGYGQLPSRNRGEIPGEGTGVG